ncbi:unnamed protein product [Prunus brigantina]
MALESSESELGNQTLGKLLKQLDGHNRRVEELAATKEQQVTGKRWTWLRSRRCRRSSFRKKLVVPSISRPRHIWTCGMKRHEAGHYGYRAGQKDVALEEIERSKDAKVEAALKEAVEQYQSSEKFTVLLEKEVGLEMVDLIYRFKGFNPGQKLNLNFAANFPPLPEGSQRRWSKSTRAKMLLLNRLPRVPMPQPNLLILL